LNNATGGRGVFSDLGLPKHALESRNVNDVERERAFAKRVDPVDTITLAEPDETVALTHLHPGQGPCKKPLGVDADVLAESSCPCDEPPVSG
jgi:hypothetical protein